MRVTRLCPCRHRTETEHNAINVPDVSWSKDHRITEYHSKTATKEQSCRDMECWRSENSST
ncbi:MAG: hypothetical protein MJZ82_01960 [Paludibacteraceae bacterium]|nr:hypothetical protein [Paludibacteraceae bacterium]